MYTYEGTVEYKEPKTAVVTIETPNSISLVEAEDMIIREFEEQYPEAEESELLGEVKELN